MTRRTTRLIACLLTLACGREAMGQQAVDPAAVEDAVESLCRQIEAQSLGPRMSVGEYLRLLGKRDDFKESLRTGDVVGGTRSTDGRTTEVRIDMPGQRVADCLVRLAARSPRSPLTPESMKDECHVWAWRTFTSVGVSNAPAGTGGGAGGVAVQPGRVSTGAQIQISPPPSGVMPAEKVATSRPAIVVKLDASQPPAWMYQDCDGRGSAPWAGSRLQTVREAEVAARRRLHDDLGRFEVATGTTLAQWAGSDARVRAEMDLAVASARLSQVEFPADGSASVRVSVDTRRLWQNLLTIH